MTSSYPPSPSPPLPQTQAQLQGRVQQLESDNNLLQSEVNMLQETILATRQKHAHELSARTDELKNQNHHYRSRLRRQNELVTNMVDTIYSAFADYKQQLRAIKRGSSDGGDNAAAATHEIRVYSDLEPDVR